MSELSREMEKHSNPRKWIEIHEEWVGKKRDSVSSLTSFTLSTRKTRKAE